MESFKLIYRLIYDQLRVCQVSYFSCASLFFTILLKQLHQSVGGTEESSETEEKRGAEVESRNASSEAQLRTIYQEEGTVRGM